MYEIHINIHIYIYKSCLYCFTVKKYIYIYSLIHIYAYQLIFLIIYYGQGLGSAPIYLWIAHLMDTEPPNEFKHLNLLYNFENFPYMSSTTKKENGPYSNTAGTILSEFPLVSNYIMKSKSLLPLSGSI